MALTLYGYRYSVYTRIARMALSVGGVAYDTSEVNPFDNPPDRTLMKVTPFQRVPVLDHDGFVLFETSAITRYVAARFGRADLVPSDPDGAARMQQVIAIVDAYGYWPMVRQVFSHLVFRPMSDQPGDKDQITEGLARAHVVLSALEAIAAERLVLNPARLTLADLHLAPMIGYLAMAGQGRATLAEFPALGSWWRGISRHSAYVATDPGLATPAPGGYSKT